MQHQRQVKDFGLQFRIPAFANKKLRFSPRSIRQKLVCQKTYQITFFSNAYEIS